MLSRHVLALDLDRTLFNTDLFVDVLVDISAKLLGAANNEFQKEMMLFTKYSSGLSFYDYFAHLENHKLAYTPELLHDLLLALKDAANSYLYSDVKLFLEDVNSLSAIEPFILSFGEIKYLKLKYDLCNELHQLALHTTLENKSTWLSNKYDKKVTGLLIDDKDDYGTLPPNWQLYLLRRDQGDKLDANLLHTYLLE